MPFSVLNDSSTVDGGHNIILFGASTRFGRTIYLHLPAHTQEQHTQQYSKIRQQCRSQLTIVRRDTQHTHAVLLKRQSATLFSPPLRTKEELTKTHTNTRTLETDYQNLWFSIHKSVHRLCSMRLRVCMCVCVSRCCARRDNNLWRRSLHVRIHRKENNRTYYIITCIWINREPGFIARLTMQLHYYLWLRSFSFHFVRCAVSRRSGHCRCCCIVSLSLFIPSRSSFLNGRAHFHIWFTYQIIWNHNRSAFRFCHHLIRPSRSPHIFDGFRGSSLQVFPMLLLAADRQPLDRRFSCRSKMPWSQRANAIDKLHVALLTVWNQELKP